MKHIHKTQVAKKSNYRYFKYEYDSSEFTSELLES